METNTPTSISRPVLLEQWTGTKLPVHKRGRTWYIVAGAIVLGGIVYGAVSGSWLFSLVCILLAGLHYRVHAKDDHHTHTLGIAREGVFYDGTFFRWQDLQGFWLIVGLESVDVRLPIVGSATRELCIHVPREQENHTRLTLSQFTTELHDRKENVFDMISRICKI